MADLQSIQTEFLEETDCHENPHLREYYINRIKQRVESGARTGIHASEVDGTCLYKTVLRRTTDYPPDKEDDEVLRFMRGWALENYIAPGLQLPVTKDGITCTVDDMIPEFGISEIKSTAKSLKGFHPVSTYYWWTHRMMIYAYAHGVTSFNLVVYFVRGNYKDIQHAFKAWTFTWTPHTLSKFWVEYVIPRRDLLKSALEGRVLDPDKYKVPLMFDTKPECDYCEWKKCGECLGVGK